MSRPSPAGAVRRFFVSDLAAGELTLDAHAKRHAQVVRASLGDAVELFDGKGRRARAVVLAMKPFRCLVDAPQARPDRSRPTLILGTPKKLDVITRAATELSARAIHLVSSTRSVSRWAASKEAEKLERLRRVTIEALRQSEGDYLPDLFAPAPLSEVLSRAPEEGYFFDARGGQRIRPGSADAWLAVGPEGGFTDDEKGRMERHGFSRASLGETILRVETAVITALAITLASAPSRA